MEGSKIQWTTHTFNPWLGCSKVHEGCTHCYAEADMATRRKRVKWGPQGTRSRTSDAYWREPLKWNRAAEGATERPRVFCASLADVSEDWQGPIVDAQNRQLFRRYMGPAATGPKELVDGQPNAPLTMNDLRRDLFALIDATPNLDWLLLTKRPENVRRMWPAIHPWQGKLDKAAAVTEANASYWYRENCWLGTSISLQKHADEQLPALLKCRDLCPVLFVSVEPLLGPIEFSDVSKRSDAIQQLGKPSLHGIDWLVCGGESGGNSRPFNLAWARSLRDQCAAAGVAFFLKQLGAVVHASDAIDPLDQFPNPDKTVRRFGQGPDHDTMTIGLMNRKGGDMAEWPEDLRVRQFPTTKGR